jgi:hypothetical protein
MILVGFPLYFFGFFGLYIPEYAINKYIPPCIFRVAKNDSIAQFISAISKGGGMSMTNGYDVEFEVPTGLKEYIQKVAKVDPNAKEASKPGYLISLLCDEAQLPNIQAATSQISGVHLGEGQISYPHTKLYSDFSLSWMCDANMTPFKFINAWHNYIFNGMTEEIKPLLANRLGTVKTAKPNPIERATRLKYPNEYLAIARITKTERGASAANSRASVSYILQDCYPYSIDATPLSYGTSQITKVTANFYYRKHTLVYNDISGYRG